jgi:hypothetical protein
MELQTSKAQECTHGWHARHLNKQAAVCFLRGTKTKHTPLVAITSLHIQTPCGSGIHEYNALANSCYPSKHINNA